MPNSLPAPNRFALTALGLLVLGCTGDLGDTTSSPEPEGPPPPETIEPKTVPASPEVLTTEELCFPLSLGERVVSVTPEGQLWLATDAGETTVVRVVDPIAPEQELGDELELSNIAKLQAWTASDGAVVAADGLWRLENFARIDVATPEGFTGSGQLCGNPSTNGFLFDGGLLFEHRNDENWWVWDSSENFTILPDALLTFDGECQSVHNAVWLTSVDGTLFRVGAAEVEQTAKFEGFAAAAATQDTIAVLANGELLLGPDTWQPWQFVSGAPTLLTASGGYAWTQSGGQVLRLTRDDVAMVQHSLAEPITGLYAHGGGVWIAGDSNACHYATQPMVRVMGLMPYERLSAGEFEFGLRPADPAMSVEVTLDGEPVKLTPMNPADAPEGEEDLGWLVATGNLGSVGWHAFELNASGSGELPAAARSLLVKRVPLIERSWAADIQPLYESNCTNGACHSDGGSPDAPPLATYEDWVALADAIQARVVDAGNMPPPGTVEGWGPEQVQVISEWLEGGMLP